MKLIYTALLSLLLAPFIASATPTITGSSSICVGAIDSLTYTPGGGSWSITNPTVASILSSGFVIGVSPGTATVLYTVSGSVDSFTITVMGATTPSAISGPASVSVGANITLTDATSGGTWSTSSSSIASVNSATGVVHGVSPGWVQISYGISSACGLGYARDSIHVLGTTGISHLGNSGAISIYPNPTAGVFNINSDQALNTNATLIVSDITGKAIVSKSISSLNTSIDLSAVMNGVYFVAIKSAEVNYMTKIVVAH